MRAAQRPLGACYGACSMELRFKPSPASHTGRSNSSVVGNTSWTSWTTPLIATLCLLADHGRREASCSSSLTSMARVGNADVKLLFNAYSGLPTLKLVTSRRTASKS